MTKHVEAAAGVIDWSKRPEPWSWIGPQFRRECEEIAAAKVGPRPHEALKRRREKLGLTQARVAQIAKMGQSHVSRAERGEAGLSIIKHINDALDRYSARKAARQ